MQLHRGNGVSRQRTLCRRQEPIFQIQHGVRSVFPRRGPWLPVAHPPGGTLVAARSPRARRSSRRCVSTVVPIQQRSAGHPVHGVAVHGSSHHGGCGRTGGVTPWSQRSEGLHTWCWRAHGSFDGYVTRTSAHVQRCRSNRVPQPATPLRPCCTSTTWQPLHSPSPRCCALCKRRVGHCGVWLPFPSIRACKRAHETRGWG
jgi:hypothetical protein